MSTPTSETRPRKSAARFVVPLVLLVLMVGGLAWLAQNLPSWRDPAQPKPAPQPAGKPQLAFFTPQVARWEKAKEVKVEPAKDGKPRKKGDPDDEPVTYGFKEFEPQMKGHYDFLFKNMSAGDLEIGLKQTGCDCASVAVCVLPAQVWDRVLELQKEKPGETFPFDEEPAWHELSFDAKKKPFSVKPDELGIIRAKWTARKSGGQELKLYPAIWAQTAGNPSDRIEYPFMIPGIMSLPVRVYPTRLSIGIVDSKSVRKVEFHIWSSTRKELNVKVGSQANDPLVVVDLRPLSKEECEKLDASWRENKEFMSLYKLPTRVLSAYHATVTVHESKDGQRLSQGAFYRQLPIILDDIAGNTDLHGPELVGRVELEGNFQIGGADDKGRILFKAFDARIRTTKEVELAAEANAILTPFESNPATLEVVVTKDEKNPIQDRSRWKLKVTVPANTFFGSFTDAHAVTLRIEGKPARFVRIPIEGNGGR